MTATGSRWALASIAIVCGVSANAVASVGFEQYPGPRPPEADTVMPKLARELALLGDQLGVDARKLLGYVKLPAVMDPRVTATDIAEKFKLGKKALIQGQVGPAARMLDAGNREAADNGPVALHVDNLEELRFDGLVALALLRSAQSDVTGAKLVMADAYRTYPDHPATLTKHTTDGVNLWTTVRDEQNKLPLGQWNIFVDDANVNLAINEVPRGRDGKYEGKHVPGTYRLLAYEDDTAYRYDVDIVAGGARLMNIAWDVQPWLEMSDRWFGFSGRPLTDDVQTRYIRSIVNMFAGNPSGAYFAVSMKQLGGRWYLWGKVYEQAGFKEARGGQVELGHKDDDDRIRAFAKFLHDGEESPFIQPLTDVPTGPRTAPRGKPDLLFTWMTGGLAVTFFAVGGWALYMDGKPNCFFSDVCGQPYDSATVGYIGLGAGAAMAALSVYSYISERSRVRSASKPSAAILPTRGGAMASVGWKF